jgi:adenylate cyclase
MEGSMRVRVDGVGELEAVVGDTLLQITLANGVAHYHACGGQAACSTCRVCVLEGADNLSPPKFAERKLAAEKGFSPDIRLACQTRVEGPVHVRRLVVDAWDADAASSTNRTGPAKIASTGEAKTVAVLFSDIRGFTSLTERTRPYDLLHMLNRYLHGVGEAILGNGGHIDKYMGDGVMAVFGLEGEGAGHAARRSVAAALQMRQALAAFNAYATEQYGEQFEMGVGIHVGQAVLGEVGHPSRRASTVLGDVVNTAARIEAATKGRAPVLVSQAVAGHLEGVALGREFEVTLRGKALPLGLVEVVC